MAGMRGLLINVAGYPVLEEDGGAFVSWDVKFLDFIERKSNFTMKMTKNIHKDLTFITHTMRLVRLKVR